MQSKLHYLHDNPRRKGFVREATAWRFSSAAYWAGDAAGETIVGANSHGLRWVGYPDRGKT